MRLDIDRIVACAVAAASLSGVCAQAPVSVGKASYAPAPPAYKARTDEHNGFNASQMMTRRVYADEKDRNGNPRPLPTNDWWTDVINNRFSGALWSYPAMVKTSATGVDICYPTHWNENGTEVKSDSWLRIGGKDFSATDATAADWHDWDVEIRMRAEEGEGMMLATLVHGNPFTIVEFSGVTPELAFSATPEIVERTEGGVLLRIGADYYGVWYDREAHFGMSGGMARIEGTAWVSAGLLPEAGDFADYSRYAATAVRGTKVTWNYDERTSLLSTRWEVEAESLRGKDESAPVMQGFLPHAYKHAVTVDMQWDGKRYLTPRGEMKMARSEEGTFGYDYRFSGMLPYYAAPSEAYDAGYNHATMRSLMAKYASEGSFGSDTYWGGKGLTQMALNMTFARQTGETEIYEQSKARLRSALEDWLTYTPGEETGFFSYYPRWGGMLGFDVSYDSDAFNDHHFHYGYFIYAAALLCMEDEDFRDGYGEILRMIVKDYANYDRADVRFPFLRTLDPWAGHSYAGGLGDHGNDNGNGQESSSEAMQSWGAIYLLGVALGDNAMRDAGIFGWLTESRGTAEYWFDRDHIRPGETGNYDYTLYGSPYNTNITSKGIGWWTWFSGDPLWMHSIQWMPVSPCLNYLSEDLDFVKWDYEKMISSTDYRWFEKSAEGDPLADQSVGNVVLCYMERYDPEGAAAIFDEALERGSGIARNADTGHISYYVIHNHLTYGDIDFDVSADCPTATAYRRSDGSMTYAVYNPDSKDREVTFYRDGSAEKRVKAPAGRLTAFDSEAHAETLLLESSDGTILPPGHKTALTARMLDQYGAVAETGGIGWSVTGAATITGTGVLEIADDAAKGSAVTVRAESGSIGAELTITVNDIPRTERAAIKGVPAIAETGMTLALRLETEDQYGNLRDEQADWTMTDPEGVRERNVTGNFTPVVAGNHVVTARHGDTEVTETVTVLPPLGNVAAGCYAEASSEENAGTLTGNATDGDHGTRWGSAHTDNEWIMLDLGADYRMTSVTIDWEAAYAADYDVETAPDGADPYDPAAWQTAHSERGHSHAGITRHAISATGRYVRVNCLRRATDYGYSLYEIEVGGIRADAPAGSVAGIDIVMPATASENERVPIGARVIRLDGSRGEAEGVTWKSDKEGVFGRADYTPTTYGMHTVTASSGSLTASRTLFVDEATRLAGVTATPEKQTVLTGDAARVEAEGRNQFGGIYPLDNASLSVRVRDGQGNEVSDGTAEYDIASGLFTARIRGDYTIDFGGMATAAVSVRDVAEANLASGKPARASSSLGGNTPDKAFDDDMDSRWESEFVDEAWLTVNLKGAFVLDRLELYWEAAYATAYSIETSTDGENWVTVHSTDSGKGSHETVPIPETPARHVRLNCKKRATGYGNSLHEMQVYGLRRADVETGMISGLYDSGIVEIRNLQGIMIWRGPRAEMPRGMVPGVYIVNGRKVRI